MKSSLKYIIRTILSSTFLFFLFFSFPNFVFAQSNTNQPPPAEERLEGVVTTITEEKKITFDDKEQLYQKLEFTVTSEKDKGRKINIENGNLPSAHVQKYEVGDKIVVMKGKDFQGKELFYITDYVRRGALLWLFIIFVILTIVIGKKRGLASLAGMGLSFLMIFFFILPQISAGFDPIVITITASFFIIPATFYLSHGFNRKTTAAVIGTIIALIITGVLANIFVDLVKLTGFASEEAGFLESVKSGTVNIQALLLAGIIIGAVGILDDITISQSAIVYQLQHISPKVTFKELYTRAMDIGQDHIASMVNTLVLVYTGAALPLLLLFVSTPHPFIEIINYEIIAEEIVRTLIASIGLILAVPITTLLACAFVKKIV